MKTLLFLITILLISACKSNEEVLYGLTTNPDCKVSSPFVTTTGLNSGSCAFSTSERKLTGLALIDVSQPGKVFQHPTWTNKGSLGPLAIDEKGNAYVAPIPFVNVLDAIRKNQNVIYKVDAASGQMQELLSLKDKANLINKENAYGVVGLFYDCQNKYLYATSLQGSTKANEKGTIYCIDPHQTPAKIITTIKSIDAMGIGVATFNDYKYLFYGSTRDHSIYRVKLKEDGTFDGKPIFCFSLTGLGPRGDDIAKKIRFTPSNQMQLTGMDFHYNLTAPTQVQETKYLFQYSVNDGKWTEIYKN